MEKPNTDVDLVYLLLTLTRFQCSSASIVEFEQVYAGWERLDRGNT